MPDFLSQQFVRIRPDLSTFRAETQAEVAGALRGLGTGRSAAAARIAGITLGDAVGTGISQSTGRIQLAGLTGATLRAQRPQIEASVAAALATTPVIAAASGGAAGRVWGTAFGASVAERTRASLVGLRTALGGTPIIGTTAIVAGAIVAGQALRGLISEASDFEAALNELRVVARPTERDLERIATAAKDLGADISLPAVSAGDAARSMTELAKAGLDTENVLDGVRGVLELGTAANLDFASSAEIVANALNAFRLPGQDASRIADLLAGAALAAQGEIADFGIAMQQAAAAAAQVGVPVEDAVTALTLLARAGIQGSDAGTSLRVTLLRLVPQTKEAADLTRALGIEIQDSEGRIRPLGDIFEQYRVSLGRLPPVIRQAALTQIFGTDAFRAASIFAQAGIQDFEQVRDTITRQGIASEVAAGKTEGLRGAFAGLTSNLETFGVTTGSVALPALEGLVERTSDAVSTTNALAEALPALRDRLEETVPFADDLGSALVDAVRFGATRLGPVGFFNATIDGAEALQRTLGLVGEEGAEDLERLRTPLGLVAGDADAATRGVRGLGLAFGDVAADALQAFQGTGLQALGGFADAATREAAAASIRTVSEVTAELETSLELLRVQGDQLGAAGVEAVSRLIAELSQMGPQGRAALRAIGVDLSEALGEGIDDGAGRAVAAARRMLEDVRREGERQIIEAIRSARENFESLGEELAGQVAQLIDVGAIAQRIAEVDRQLEALQERVSRRRLRFDFREAERDLEDAQRSIVRVGEVTPAQKRAQEEFLEPFREKVADAKSALKEFDLSEHREDLEDTLEKQKRLAQEGLLKLVDSFEQGRISAGDFNRLLSRQLGPTLDTLRSKAGRDLGFIFTRDFLRNLETVRSQAEAIAGFLGTAGTTPGPRVVRPAETVADVQRRIADASANLLQVQKDAKRQQHDDAEDMKQLLRDIRAAVRPGATKQTTVGRPAGTRGGP